MLEPRFAAAPGRHALVDQQLWYAGRDITAPDGNGLVRYGFRRIRCPGGRGTSCYLLDATADRPRLLFWGFGLYIGDAIGPDESLPAVPMLRHGDPVRGIVLERFRARPLLTRSPVLLPVHQPSDLTRLVAAQDAVDVASLRQLLGTLATALAAYERWAVATLGVAHRQRALEDVPRHKRRRFAPEPSLAEHWLALAQREGGMPTATVEAA